MCKCSMVYIKQHKFIVRRISYTEYIATLNTKTNECTNECCRAGQGTVGDG